MNIKRLTSDNKISIIFACVLISLAVVSRLMPHPANFTPLAAIALFGGALLPRRLAVSLPLVAMVVSDLIIGLHPTIYATWGSFAVIALVSSLKFRKVNVANVLASSLAASVFFFLVTNFAVWLEGRLYAPTISGLVQCYYNALPFFRNTLTGDLVFTTSLFGLFALSVYLAKQLHTERTEYGKTL